MSAPDGLVVEDVSIPSDTPGIALHLRRKRRRDIAAFSAARTVLMMHGATRSSAALFDVPIGGISTMDRLALAGYDVHALDVRGYGGSTRPPEMDAPPDDAAPQVRTAVAVRDLGSAVDHILVERGLDKLALVAMSWGGSVAGAYTTAHNDKVARLALIAPQWLSEGTTRIDPGGPLGAYRWADVNGFRARWLEPAPEAARDGLIPPGVFEAFAKISLADDPAARDGKVRAPNGAVLDVREFWGAGRPVYEPGDIHVPVLLTHAEWDADVTLERTQAYFRRLTGAPERRWLEVGEGTHMVILEKNGRIVVDAIIAFLNEGA